MVTWACCSCSRILTRSIGAVIVRAISALAPPAQNSWANIFRWRYRSRSIVKCFLDPFSGQWICDGTLIISDVLLTCYSEYIQTRDLTLLAEAQSKSLPKRRMTRKDSFGRNARWVGTLWASTSLNVAVGCGEVKLPTLYTTWRIRTCKANCNEKVLGETLRHARVKRVKTCCTCWKCQVTSSCV